jgi:hypothetical protein
VCDLEKMNLVNEEYKTQGLNGAKKKKHKDSYSVRSELLKAVVGAIE